MFDYFKRLAVPAVVMTLELLGWEEGGKDWIRICLSAIALVLAAILGISALALDLWFLGTLLVLGCVLTVPGIFFWKLLVAAYELDEGLRAELASSQQPAWHFDALVAKKLQDLLKQGNELVGDRTIPEQRLPENVWVEDMVSWCARAQDLIIRNLPRADATGFITISVFPKVDHSRTELEKILQVRLKTLREIVLRYMEFAPG
jgi:hypothetical protein